MSGFRTPSFFSELPTLEAALTTSKVDESAGYVDRGPFTMSRYLTEKDLYEAMANHIDRVERERDELKNRCFEMQNAAMDLREKLAKADAERSAFESGLVNLRLQSLAHDHPGQDIIEHWLRKGNSKWIKGEG